MVQARISQGRVEEHSSISAPIRGEGDDRDRAVEEAVRICLANGDFRGKKTVLCLCGEDVLIQQQRVTLDSENESRESIQKKISQEFRLNLARDIDTDFTRILSTGKIYERHECKEEMIIVVVKRELVWRYVRLLEKTGLCIHRIGVEPFAFFSAYLRFWPEDAAVKGDESPQESPSKAIINMGESKTEVVIVRNGHPAFVRSLSVGMEKFTESIAAKMNLDKEEMGQLIGEMREGREVSGIVRDAIMNAVRPDFEFMCSEIMTCFRYFSSTSKRDFVERVIVLGDCVNSLFSKDLFRERLGLPVLGWTEEGEESDQDPAPERFLIEPQDVSLVALALEELDGKVSNVDFLPFEITEKREKGRANRMRFACLGAALVLMWAFHVKSGQREVLLGNICGMFKSRCEMMELTSESVAKLLKESKKLKNREKVLLQASCPLLPTRVLAEITRATGPGISLGKMSMNFTFGKSVVKSGKKKKTVVDYSKPILMMTIEGVAASPEEVSLFVGRLKDSGAFSSIHDDGFSNVRGENMMQKQFTVRLEIGKDDQ